MSGCNYNEKDTSDNHNNLNANAGAVLMKEAGAGCVPAVPAGWSLKSEEARTSQWLPGGVGMGQGLIAKMHNGTFWVMEIVCALMGMVVIRIRQLPKFTTLCIKNECICCM